MIEISRPPWTEEEVANLNRWQECDWVHPFTCHNGHTLKAFTGGWFCVDKDCWYTQQWAHDFMLNGPPEPPKIGIW